MKTAPLRRRFLFSQPSETILRPRLPMLLFQPRPVRRSLLQRLVRPEIIRKQPVHGHLKRIDELEASKAPDRFEYRAHPRFLAQPTRAG
jgi:hypothetical protein